MEAQLLKAFRHLDETRQKACLDYVLFLVQQQNESDNITLQQPIAIEKSANETVVAAIKRLSDSYPMLAKEKMLEPVNQLMNEHLLQGKDALLVISQIELLFQQQYALYCKDFKQTHPYSSQK